MPRNRPRRPNGATPAGPVMPVSAPAQPPVAATGQDYGAAGQQLAAQAAMPLPAAVDPLAMAEQAAMALRPPDPSERLNAPSQRPDEPVTAGLPSGPGPGPEALGIPSVGRVAGVLREVAAITGNDTLLAAARDAEMRGI